MAKNIKKLASFAGIPLCVEAPQVTADLLASIRESPEELLDLLNAKNGFYAFESALHLFPAGTECQGMGLETWNSSSGWRAGYGDLVAGCVFFAEDAFGTQFALSERGVERFDPETGQFERMAKGPEEWAGKILDDYEYLTGFPLAHEWQIKNGPLAIGKRLIPKIPFVLGGTYDLSNLYAADALKGMRFRADIWRQIRDLPDGSQIKVTVID